MLSHCFKYRKGKMQRLVMRKQYFRRTLHCAIEKNKISQRARGKQTIHPIRNQTEPLSTRNHYCLIVFAKNIKHECNNWQFFIGRRYVHARNAYDATSIYAQCLRTINKNQRQDIKIQRDRRHPDTSTKTKQTRLVFNMIWPMVRTKIYKQEQLLKKYCVVRSLQMLVIQVIININELPQWFLTYFFTKSLKTLLFLRIKNKPIHYTGSLVGKQRNAKYIHVFEITFVALTLGASN